MDYVQDWIKDFISILDEERRTDIKIEVQDITISLQAKIKNPDFPISILLWEHLKTEINKLPTLTTAEELRKALQKAFKAFDAEMATKYILKQHFKDHRTTYRSIKRKDLNKQTMFANDFEIWLVELLEVAKEKQKRREEEQEKLEDAFKVAYGKWLFEQRRQIFNFVHKKNTTYTVDSMSREIVIARLLEISKDWKKVQPELTQELTQRIIADLQKWGASIMPIDSYVDTMNAAYSNLTTPETTIAQHWYKHRQFFDIGDLIAVLSAGG
ncbi:MAG: hypothetical protein ACRBFS_09130 [Aureispira sp.]